VAVFNGVTGRVIKSSGTPLSNFASVSLEGTKVDKITGKGLSTEDFSTEEKSKLAALSPHYRGTYATTALVDSEVVDPVAGDYALVEVVGEPQQVSFWDATNDEWDHKVVEPMTGEEIATALFDTEDSATYAQETCRIFTDAEKVQLAQHESLIGSLNLNDLSKPYGAIYAFTTSIQTDTNFTTSSDGSSAYVPINSPGALVSTDILNFDNGGVTTGRLRYTAAVAKKFLINAVLSFSSAAVTARYYTALAKNGNIILETRQNIYTTVNTTNNTVSMTGIVTLGLNDYLEIHVANATGTEAMNVRSMAISTVAI
jgi:hypothetical protein